MRDRDGLRPYHDAMPPPRPSTTLFEDAIDIPLWLESDRDTPFATRSRRDREIGSQLKSDAKDARVRGWWTRIALLTSRSPNQTGERLQRTRSLVTVVMIGIGSLSGVGVALAAFHYDGSRPVNVVTLLATLVIAQLVLLLLTLLLIPRGIPGLRAIQDLLATISPGALAASIYRRIADVPRDTAPLFGWHPGRAAAASRFAKWLLLYWSQTAAVAFNLAVIATGIALVTFTDLAFGWSTTLHADVRSIAFAVDTLSVPWRSWLPSAVPDITLIERSQFFRLGGASAFDLAASSQLTGWWSFVILAVVTYGLIPRGALLALAALRLRSATRTLLVEDPRVVALLDRMATPALETAAGAAENPRIAEEAPDQPRHRTHVGTARAVIWSGSIDPAAAEAYARGLLGVVLDQLVEAGGGRTLEEDRAVLAEVSDGKPVSIIVFTRAWEPPLLEFLDFIKALREAIGRDVSIVVVPIAETAGNGVEQSQRDTWARAIGRAADPHLYLETGAT